MAEKYSFFDPVLIDGLPDREYNAQEFTDYFASLVTTGIMKGAGAELKVTANGSNMFTEIDTGIALVEGRYYANTAKLAHTHDTETLGKDRIDRIVVRLDLNTEARYVRSFIKKGVASASPVPPALTRNAAIYEISLAQVKVIGGQTYINANNVTDERGDGTVCPWAGSRILPNFDDAALEDLVNKLERMGTVTDTKNTLLSIHVNGVTGSDETGDGTNSKPYKTIGFAVSEMPKSFFGMGVELVIHPATYNEDVFIRDIVGTTLKIRGTNRDTVNVKQIHFTSCRCSIEVSNFTMVGTTPFVANLQFIRCPYADVRFLTIKNSASGARGIMFLEGSNGFIAQTSISNKQYAIMVDTGFVKTFGLTGSGNTTAYSTAGGTIYRGGTNPSATTLEEKSNGGQIYS